MYLNLIPDRILSRYPSTYENFLSAFFKVIPAWNDRQSKKVLYVREPKSLLYWGLNRDKLYWMRDWIFCYEAHDTLGLDPQIFLDAINKKEYTRSKEEQNVLTAARNFNLIICNTKRLADDMKLWSNNTIQPVIITLASPVPQLELPPRISFKDTVKVGYIGTVDTYRGVDILFRSFNFLPKKFNLRIVGRFRKEEGIDPNWIDEFINDEGLKDRLDVAWVTQIENLCDEIDRCDILIQPASRDILDSIYAAPLKSFGYMKRGNPILAGDVPCHRELFNQGDCAMLYALNPQNLASSIQYVSKHPTYANKIACNAWTKSADFSFDRKVKDLITHLHSLI
jgi:glycosyltransferase involved in cell wall biosynthesis